MYKMKDMNSKVGNTERVKKIGQERKMDKTVTNDHRVNKRKELTVIPRFLA